MPTDDDSLITLSYIFLISTDLISTKSQASSKKAADTERLSSSNSSGLGTSASGEMYENMTFHRKVSGLAFWPHTLLSNRGFH